MDLYSSWLDVWLLRDLWLILFWLWLTLLITSLLRNTLVVCIDLLTLLFVVSRLAATVSYKKGFVVSRRDIGRLTVDIRDL